METQNPEPHKLPEIPPVIISDLLCRLPIKSLVRFRCVSKRWCSEIDSPYFIKTHFKRSIEASSNLNIVLGVHDSLYMIDFDTLNKAFVIEKSLKKPVVLGASNGLLLVKRYQIGNNLAIFNPTTRKFHFVPNTPLISSYCFADPAYGTYGFGYDPVNDDYKVISVVEFVDKNRFWVGSETQIYSLKKNSWKRIKDFPFCLPNDRVWGVYAQGALHTVVQETEDCNWPKRIVVTDLISEDYGVMEPPDFPLKEMMVGMTIDKLGEFLCLHAIYGEFRHDMWVMKEYGLKGSWMKLLSVEPPVIPLWTTLDTLAYSKDGNKILLNRSDEKLVWYDLKMKNFIDAPVHGLPQSFDYADLCVGSLVRFDSYLGADKNKKLAQEKPKENKSRKKRDDFLSKGFKLKL